MNGDRVYFYRERNRDELIPRADLFYGGVWLYGLRLQVDADGLCTGLTLPPQEDTEALCALLADEDRLDRICQALLERLPGYLKQQELELYRGREQVIPRGEAQSGRYLFHTAGLSRYAEGKRNLLCSAALPDGKELCGVRLEWLGDKAMTVRFPTQDALRQADAILRAPGAPAEIAAFIRGTVTSRLAGRPSPARAKEGPAAAHKEEFSLYGRLKNADNSNLLKYTPGNVLRPTEMVEKLLRGRGRYFLPKADPENCARALGSGDLGMADIELLENLAQFRYLTNAMLHDLYACGRITQGGRRLFIGSKRMKQQLDKLKELCLITECRFFSLDVEQKNVGRENAGIAMIYTISPSGGTLLQELGRKARFSSFDVYQDGNTVRECLSANQWLLYWLNAYPEAVTGRFALDQIVYGLGAEMNGAWLGAWLTVGGRMLAALPLRRCAEAEQAAAREELTKKAARLASLFAVPEQLYSFENGEYRAMKLDKAPILCWICEDEAHLEETAALLAPYVREGQSVWLSYDQRLFNYSFEGQRFRPLAADGPGDWLDPGAFLGLGEERREEKRLERERGAGEPLTVNGDGTFGV